MRILHLIQRYEPAKGGAEIHLAAFSQRLAADGHEVLVATSDAIAFDLFWNPHSPRLMELETSVDGVQVRRFRVRHLPGSPMTYNAVRRLLWWLSRLRAPTPVLVPLARLTPNLPGLWRWLQNTNKHFDLVAGMNISFEPLIAAGLQFARRVGVPFVVYPLTHLGAAPRPAADEISSFHTMRHQIALVTASDALIAQTQSERDFYAAHGMPPDHIHVVGPGVTPTAVTGGAGQAIRKKLGLKNDVVFSLGTMSFDKGTVHLVEAVSQLWANGRSLHLVLAGKPLTDFQQYLEALPPAVRRRIHLLPNVSDDEKRALLAAADLFVMPSRSDSFGIVYLEAWLNHLPVIAADAWGVKDVISHGIDGLLVPFGDIPALSDAIITLLDQPDEARRLGENGAQKAMHHTWDQKYHRIRAIYQELAG